MKIETWCVKKYNKYDMLFESQKDALNKLKHFVELCEKDKRKIYYCDTVLERCKNWNIKFNGKSLYEMVEKSLERISKLKENNRNVSIIDLDLYRIYFSEDIALKKYNEMINRKTEKWSGKNKNKDSKSLKFFITKFGEEVGTEKYKKSLENFRKISPRCVEYWIEKGLTKKDSIDAVKSYQAKGSLENFVKRYGKREGNIKWQKRQIKWQKSLKDKSQEEINFINSKKSALKKIWDNRDNLSIEEIKEKMSKANKRLDVDSLVFSIESFIKILKVFAETKCFTKRSALSLFPKIQFYILGITDPIKFMSTYITYIEEGEVFIPNKYAGHSMSTEHGYLRSSYEIYAYNLLVKTNLNFSVGKRYVKGSDRRSYDFYIEKTNTYLEISPLYNKNDDIKNKIDKKILDFDNKNIVVLKTFDEIHLFIKSLV